LKSATITQLRKELSFRSNEELQLLCLQLARFKKENKELLTYALFDSENEQEYIEQVKTHISDTFKTMNASNSYYIKKRIRKTLQETKKYIRYSKARETEIQLLIHFCLQMKSISSLIKNSKAMNNIYNTQVALIKKHISKLHEDLQFDYFKILKKTTL